MLFDPPVMTYVVEKPIEVSAPKKDVVKKQIPVKEKVISTTIKVIEDPAKFVETPVAATDVPAPSEPVVANTPTTPVKNSGPENVNSVEFVPVFPGCESLLTNNERKECMSSMIREFIAKEFKSDKFSHMDSGKSHRIGVQFKIDSNGAVTEIVARAPDAALEKEAQRVISKLPRMKSGKQGNLPVEVMYTVPIVFQTN
jgi:protein TonB